MVQTESSASYDNLMEEHGPEGSDRLREGVQAAAKSLVESLNAGWKQIADAAESFAREKMQVIDTVAAKVERWAAEAREMAGMAAQSASEAKEAGEQIQAARAAEQELVHAQAEELIAAARQEISEAVRASNEALASAKQAAEEARSAALVAATQAAEAKNASAQKGADLHTQELVERLEADYRLLTELVQSLHNRIAGLGEAPSEPASTSSEDSSSAPFGPEATSDHSSSSWTSAPLEPAPAPIPFPDRSSVPRPRVPHEAPSDGAFRPVVVGTAAVQHAPASQSLSGRLIIKAAPIPDFEKLLGLDNALGRLPGVQNVTLADYSKEEVTLRVDLAEPTSVEAFVRGLAQVSGEQLEVLAAGPGQLQLRVVRPE